MTIDRWITFIGVAVSALVTWFFARYYYRRSEKKRAPTFVVHSSRKILATPEIAGVHGMSLLFDGAEVGRQGITQAQIYFWNSGNLPILQSEVLEPFTVSLSGPILRGSVAKTSRDVIGLAVSVSDRQMTLQFGLLEPGDGATIDVIYDGPADAKIEFKGACVGSPKPLVLAFDSVYLTPIRKRVKDVYTVIFAFPAMLALLASVFGLIGGIGWLLKKLFAERTESTIGQAFGVICLGGFFVFVLGSVFWKMYKNVTAPYLPPDARP